MRNYSVRTTFKYPSSDREISEVAGRAQEDEGRREKTSGWRAEKKKKKRKGHEVRQRPRRRRRRKRVVQDIIQPVARPKLVSRGGNVSSRARPRYLFRAMIIRPPEDDFMSILAKLRSRGGSLSANFRRSTKGYRG